MNVPPANDMRLKPISALSDEELQERVCPAYEAIRKEKFSKGGYLTYYDAEFCPANGHMIHEYHDRKELVKLDHNGKAHFVKIA
jgi:hypothetical protein